MVLLLLRFAGDRQSGHAQSPASPDETAQKDARPTDTEVLKAEGLSRAFRRAAQSVLPAVVVIKAGPSPVCPRCGRAHEAYDDESDEGNADAGRQRPLDVLGSGFIVAPTGVVLTNKHVVKDDPRLVVQTADGKQYPVYTTITVKIYKDGVLWKTNTNTATGFGNYAVAQISASL